MIDRITLLLALVNFSLILLISFLALSNPLKVNKSANRWFGLFLLIWSSFWIDEIAILIFNYNLTPFWQITIRYIQYYTPMLLYFSIVFYTNPNFKISTKLIWHLAHPIIYLILLSLFYYYNSSNSLSIRYSLVIIMHLQSSAYIIASYVKIRDHQKNVFKFSSNVEEIDLKWLQRIIIGMGLILVVVILYSIFYTFQYLSIQVNAFILLIIFDIAYHSLKQKEIFPFSQSSTEEVLSLENDFESVELRKSLIPDDELVVMKNKLDQLMISQKPHLDPELNLVKLAEIFGTTPHKLSYIINNGFDKNFSNFINYYRVNEAKQFLLNSKMDQFSLLGIAYEAGFSSKSSFNNAFKKITGKTPSDFKKSSQNL